MIPVYQTQFGEQGNCLQACIASLLALRLEDVPHFLEDDQHGWFNSVNRFVWQHGVHMVAKSDIQVYPYNCHYLGWGVSPRGLQHSVIYFNNDMVHDPHPDGGGVQLEQIAYFIARFA